MVTATMAAEKPPQAPLQMGRVKAVNSGDSVQIFIYPKGSTDKTLIFSNVTAPKMARRPRPDSQSTQPNDDPYAWEAREFLRQKLIGQTIKYQVDKDDGNRFYGTIFCLDKDKNFTENITETMLAEGYLSLRGNNPALLEAENRAKEAGKGKHNPKDDSSKHVRQVNWDPEPKQVLEKFGKKMVKAVIDNISPQIIIRAFVVPENYYVAFVLTGIKVVRDYSEDVRNLLEERLLHRDVKLIIESVQNEKNKILNATLIHVGRNKNVGELLLEEGYATCNVVLSGVYDEKKLREAEKKAQKEQKGKWIDFVPKKPPKERQAVVMEVISGEALNVRYPGETKDEKIFLSSIKCPPRDGENPIKTQGKPLYDVPWYFEAREFLRTRLIGKKVNVYEDFIQPSNGNFPEKKCCSVLIGQENIAEALVSKGLAKCVRYRQDEENKSSFYENLLQAEDKAEKSLVGYHNKKETPTHRVNDVSTDANRAKAIFPSLQRTSSIEGVIEFVASGSRFRIYIEREAILITFLLAGIDCPRASRPAGPKSSERIPADEFGEEALSFVKEKVLQRNVEIKVESMDKRGGMIGWMFFNGLNLSKELVEQGYARVHETAERTSYFKELKAAEERAKGLKLKRWENYKEEDEIQKTEKSFEESDTKTDRNINYIEAIITNATATPDLTIHAQKVSEAAKIDSIIARLRQELEANPPVEGSYTPKRNDLCAAKFSEDDQWYRAKVEKVSGGKADIIFIDYGNRDNVPFSALAYLPDSLREPGYAHEYKLALIKLPPGDYVADSMRRLSEELINNEKVLLNVEYNITGTQYVTVFDANTKDDLTRFLISSGLFLVEPRRDRRLQKLVEDYNAAQNEALKKRYNIWEYGDVREDDDRDFRN